MIVTCISNSLSFELTEGKEYKVVLTSLNSVKEKMYHIVNDLGQEHIYAAKRFK